jgi:hypothetical protein
MNQIGILHIWKCHKKTPNNYHILKKNLKRVHQILRGMEFLNKYSCISLQIQKFQTEGKKFLRDNVQSNNN